MKGELEFLWGALREWAREGEYFRKKVVRTIDEFSEIEDYQKTLVYLHGRLESGWQYCPAGCEESWNFFGIKATRMDRLLGRYVVSKTKEYVDGVVEIVDYFRKFKDLKDGIRGYLYLGLRSKRTGKRAKVIDLLKQSYSIDDFVALLVEYRWTTTPFEEYLYAFRINFKKVSSQFIT